MPRVKVKVTQGTDEINVGTESFRPDKDGTVEVPQEAVDALTAVGGCVVDALDDDPPAGFARMKHNGDAVVCSWDGTTYQADESGVFTVPGGAVDDLRSHGFIGVDEQE